MLSTGSLRGPINDFLKPNLNMEGSRREEVHAPGDPLESDHKRERDKHGFSFYSSQDECGVGVEGGQGHPTAPQPLSSSRPQPAHYSGWQNLLEPLMHRAGPSGRALGYWGQNPSRTLYDREMWAGVSGVGLCCVAVFNSSINPVNM